MFPLLLPLLVAGCAPQGTVLWLERSGFEWVSFNHRVSTLSFLLDGGGAELAVVGGTSSTGVAPELPEGCERETCAEYPFYDSSRLELGWARARVDGAVGSGELELELGAEPVNGELEVPLQGRAGEGGGALAVLRGWALDTDVPLDDSCYLPVNGWLPRRLYLHLGEPELLPGGEAARVPLEAAFEAGPSLEEARACLDEVVERARVRLRVQLQVVVGPGAERAELSYADSWEQGEEQPPPELSERPLPGRGRERLVGWEGFDFRFHQQDPDGRGAYLRSLSFGLDPEAGWASGQATNYSPGTQLSGFDYAFTGWLGWIELDGPPQRARLEPTLDARVDEDFRAVPSWFPLLWD